MEDEKQIVARKHLLDKGGFGFVYEGDYVIDQGKDYEYVCKVVAKKNRPRASGPAAKTEVRPRRSSTTLKLNERSEGASPSANEKGSGDF